MADLTGRNADETKPDIATWGSGNVLETGEGTVKVDLDNKASLSGGSDADFDSMPWVDGSPIVERGSNSDGEWVRIADGTQFWSRRRIFNQDVSSNNSISGTFSIPQSLDNDNYIVTASIGSFQSESDIANAARNLRLAAMDRTISDYLVGARNVGSSSERVRVAIIGKGRWK